MRVRGPDPRTPVQKRDQAYQRRYGISLTQYDQMVADQGGVCLICGNPPTAARRGGLPLLVVDHNKDTGQVRGLLCTGCNVKLHSIEDEQFYGSAHIYLYSFDSKWQGDLIDEQLLGL